MPEHTCETCRFWDQHKDQFPWVYKELGPAGVCRIVHPANGFPATYAHEWCGEHQEKR
jgi:hypothetical protein